MPQWKQSKLPCIFYSAVSVCSQDNLFITAQYNDCWQSLILVFFQNGQNNPLLFFCNLWRILALKRERCFAFGVVSRGGLKWVVNIWVLCSENIHARSFFFFLIFSWELLYVFGSTHLHLSLSSLVCSSGLYRIPIIKQCYRLFLICPPLTSVVHLQICIF